MATILGTSPPSGGGVCLPAPQICLALWCALTYKCNGSDIASVPHPGFKRPFSFCSCYFGNPAQPRGTRSGLLEGEIYPLTLTPTAQPTASQPPAMWVRQSRNTRPNPPARWLQTHKQAQGEPLSPVQTRRKAQPNCKLNKVVVTLRH